MRGWRRLLNWRALLIISIALLIGGCAQPATKEQPKGQKDLSKLPEVGSARPVKIKTEDNITLSGRIFGRGQTGIILAHMFPNDQNAWSTTAKKLSNRGYRVLTFDFRGYGMSGGNRKVSQIDKDLLAALKTMRGQTKSVFLIGASMGGTAVLNIASKEKVSGIACLSGYPQFMGLRAGKMKDIKAPKLFLASAGDGNTAQIARRFYEDSGEPREIHILEGDRHGTGMFRDDPSEAMKIIVDWLKRYK